MRLVTKVLANSSRKSVVAVADAVLAVAGVVALAALDVAGTPFAIWATKRVWDCGG